MFPGLAKAIIKLLRKVKQLSTSEYLFTNLKNIKIVLNFY